MKSSFSSVAAEASYFWLDPKVTKRSRQKKASTRPAGSLRLFRASRIAKAKPAFPPYSRLAFLSGLCPLLITRYLLYFHKRYFFSFVSRAASAEIGQNNGGLCVGRA